MAVVLALVALAACDGAGQRRIEVDGTVRYLDFEDGFWAIDGDDGVTYDPVSFPPDFRKGSWRVHATMMRLGAANGIHQAGPIVSIAALIPLQCDVPCPPPAAPVQVKFSSLLGGASLENVTGPPGTSGASCFGSPAGVSPYLACEITGTSAGTYEADVVAPGTLPLHVSYDVEPRTPLRDECCPVFYFPEHAHPGLTPGP